MFVVFVFKIKFSPILKMIQQNYHLSVNEAKMTSLCARNCANILGFELFGPKKLLDLSRNGPWLYLA